MDSVNATVDDRTWKGIETSVSEKDYTIVVNHKAIVGVKVDAEEKIMSLCYSRTNFLLVTQLRIQPLTTRLKQSPRIDKE